LVASEFDDVTSFRSASSVVSRRRRTHKQKKHQTSQQKNNENRFFFLLLLVSNIIFYDRERERERVESQRASYDDGGRSASLLSPFSANITTASDLTPYEQIINKT
jgi:hypothetical protein